MSPQWLPAPESLASSKVGGPPGRGTGGVSTLAGSLELAGQHHRRERGGTVGEAGCVWSTVWIPGGRLFGETLQSETKATHSLLPGWKRESGGYPNFSRHACVPRHRHPPGPLCAFSRESPPYPPCSPASKGCKHANTSSVTGWRLLMKLWVSKLT